MSKPLQNAEAILATAAAEHDTFAAPTADQIAAASAWALIGIGHELETIAKVMANEAAQPKWTAAEILPSWITVIGQQTDLVEVVERLRTVVCVKG